jgi:hypothetical protein
MQHSPIGKEAERQGRRRSPGEEVQRDTEEHRDQDEREATIAWLDHIPVLSLPKGPPVASR